MHLRRNISPGCRFYAYSRGNISLGCRISAYLLANLSLGCRAYLCTGMHIYSRSLASVFFWTSSIQAARNSLTSPSVSVPSFDWKRRLYARLRTSPFPSSALYESNNSSSFSYSKPIRRFKIRWYSCF